LGLLEFAARLLVRNPRRGPFLKKHLLATVGSVQPVVFTARAAGVGPGAGSLQTSRNNFALERIHPRLRKLQVALGRLLAILQSFISESGQQLSFEDFLTHFDQKSADSALDPRGHADHMLGANFPRKIDVGRRGSLRHGLGGFGLLGACARQDGDGDGGQRRKCQGCGKDDPFAAHTPRS